MAIEMWRSKLYNGGRKGNIDGTDTADVNKKRTYFPFAKRNSHVESKSFLFNFLWSLKTCSKSKVNITTCFILHYQPLFELYSLRCTLNPLKPELNPICYLLALLGAHHLFHVSRIRVKLLTLRWLMSYIYGAPILDVSRSHTTTQHSR